MVVMLTEILLIILNSVIHIKFFLQSHLNLINLLFDSTGNNAVTEGNCWMV